MPGYQTKQQSIAIAGVEDLLVRSLLDSQQFFDPLGDADRLGISSATWPFFGLLWPSGVCLADRIALRPVNPHERILEIGCGLALASLVGHRRGADITASDCHPLAERFLEANLLLNGLEPMKYRHGHWSRPAVLGHDDDTAVSGRFDLLIGSDLLYERDPDGMLAGFIAGHVRPGGEVWIIDPDRGNRSAFSRHMANRGFLVREERLDRAASDGGAAYKGRLLVYSRGTGDMTGQRVAALRLGRACHPRSGKAFGAHAQPGLLQQPGVHAGAVARQ